MAKRKETNRNGKSEKIQAINVNKVLVAIQIPSKQIHQKTWIHDKHSAWPLNLISDLSVRTLHLYVFVKVFVLANDWKVVYQCVWECIMTVRVWVIVCVCGWFWRNYHQFKQKKKKEIIVPIHQCIYTTSISTITTETPISFTFQLYFHHLLTLTSNPQQPHIFINIGCGTYKLLPDKFHLGIISRSETSIYMCECEFMWVYACKCVSSRCSWSKKIHQFKKKIKKPWKKPKTK